DDLEIRDLAQKSVVYASRWLELASAQGQPATPDLLDAADVLYLGARRLSGLGDPVASFADLEGRKIPDPNLWERAAQAHRLLLTAPAQNLSPEDRRVARSRLARSLGFAATDVNSWECAKAEYGSIVKEYKLEDARGMPDPAVFKAQPSLLPLYLELGDVYGELGRRGQRFQFDNAASVLGNSLRILGPDSQLWWRAKYRLIEYLMERGTGSDVRDARVLIENTERNNPEFDAGRFGMKDKFIELKARIRKVAGP
ncbi:MAG TPA: hypothetical protein VEN81_07010, partial [Planctomycetota bacterium]|nr:hypothetical protein [Planctomycetota bacterium]